MEVRVYNYETKALLSTFFMKGKAYKNVFSTLGMIEALQRTRDILGVGILGKASFGIKTMYTRGCLVSSMDPDSTYVITGHYSCELRPKPKEEDTTPPNTTIDGVDTGIKVGVVMYDPGWILNTGEQSYNFFGVGSPAYMKSIGTREIISGSASSARKFKSIDSVLGYIEKNRSAFDYTVKELGYVWSVEPSCSFFQMNYEDSLTERKRRKHQEDMLTLQGLLDEINNQVQPVVPDTSNIPEKVTPGSIRDEILYRMKKQSILKENVAVFKRTGEIFQSEAGGWIYTLDEGAQIAVDEARKHGLHPWHVIKNVYKEIGVIYSVLYVSEDTDAWPDERRSRDGIQMAFCWNADQEFADIGTIQTASAIGGLVRVA